MEAGESVAERIARQSLEVFRSWPLPPDRYLLQHLHTVVNTASLQNLTKGHVTLTEEPLQYLSLLEHGTVHIGIFFCKAGAQIPLHDHPGMCVFSKVLSGSIRITSFDWDCDLSVKSPWPKPCKMSKDEIIKSGDNARLLLPRKNNLHVVTAVEDSAFLDIISPPYDEKRVCTHYERVDSPPEEKNASRIYLLPAPWPEDFVVREVAPPVAATEEASEDSQRQDPLELMDTSS